MKIKIKQYAYEKKEIASKEIQLPTETSYYFETFIRRSIKITPEFTNYRKMLGDEDEEMYALNVICIYQYLQCKIEMFTILITDIENIYYSQKHEHKEFVTSLINGDFDERTKEQFNEDFNRVIKILKDGK